MVLKLYLYFKRLWISVYFHIHWVTVFALPARNFRQIKCIQDYNCSVSSLWVAIPNFKKCKLKKHIYYDPHYYLNHNLRRIKRMIFVFHSVKSLTWFRIFELFSLWDIPRKILKQLLQLKILRKQDFLRVFLKIFWP